MITLRQRLRNLSGAAAPFAAEPAMESIYRDLFIRELSRIGENDCFFPVGGAANYSLLYLILRIGTELQPRSVLDIGAGQSSLLWAMLRRRGFVEHVLTLENDPDWAARIAAQVEHEIRVTPLASRRVGSQTVRTYEWDAVKQQGPFDVVVCDGPTGTPRHSRCGVLEMLDTVPADFALVMDDVEREGEQDTVKAVHHRLQQTDIDYSVGVIRAAKSQAIFATGRFIPTTFL